MVAQKKDVKLNEKMYDILLKPIITEKTTLVAEQGKIVFAVKLDATKTDVKNAVEKVYNVKVKSVNTVMKPGKSKRFKGIPGSTTDVKKAYITLEEGHNIDIMAGLK